MKSLSNPQYRDDGRLASARPMFSYAWAFRPVLFNGGTLFYAPMQT
jgi:hypothetical protein